MKRRMLWLAIIAALVIAVSYGIVVIRHGFSAAAEPSALEKIMARTARRLATPTGAAREKNPLPATPDNVNAGRDFFLARRRRLSRRRRQRADEDWSQSVSQTPGFAGVTDAEFDGRGDSLRHPQRCPADRHAGLGNPREEQGDDIWKLVLFIRSLRAPAPAAVQAGVEQVLATAHYTGSLACQPCHKDIYERWSKTPMANVVRDPRVHPEAFLADISTNPITKISKADVGLVYGSIWKQRYFTKVGNDYYPELVQWDIVHQVWRPYFVPVTNADWWAPYYPPDNLKRPTSATCDGCHSVGYDIHTHVVVEWNVGCECCHGPGSEHVAHPTRGNIFNPATADYVSANDVCIQCHSQGRPRTLPIEGKYYDWPVGYRVGLRLVDYWKLEDHKLGETTFTHFADGTAHKNRMQGNDFVQSVMYRRGITCFSCHDVHGTTNYAQLRKPAGQLCLDCHQPMGQNGPRTATLEEHMHHRAGTPGGRCVDCHMPQIEITLGDVKVHAHTFAFITPAMTEKYRIPNACNLCHKDKSTAWVTDALRHWNERSPWRME